MYCGCNEKALCSQRAIARALLGLLEKARYNDISISALCREAGVSRPTFYSLFGSKDDVVAYLLREHWRYSPEAEAGSCLKSFCRGYSRYITAQRRFLSLLTENGLSHLLYGSICASLLDCGCFLDGTDESSRRCAANFTAGALTGVVQDYVSHEACTTEELCALLERLFSGGFFGNR